MSSLKGNLATPELAQKLWQTHQAGEFAGAEVTVAPTLRLKALLHALEVPAVDYALIEQFKKLVDQRVRSNAHDAMQVADFAISLSQLTNDPATRALGARTKGMVLHVMARYQAATVQYERARQLYRKAGLEVERARVERAMVDALIYLGRYEDALTLAAEARQVFEKHSESLLLAQLESNAGNIYHRLDRNAEALARYERAAELFAVCAPEQLAQVTFNRANVYCNLDEFRQAQRLYEQAYVLHCANEDQIGAIQTQYSLGYLHFLMGSYHQAMRVLQEVRVACLRNGDEQTAALCILDLAEIYLQLNILDEAARLAAQARELFLALGIRYEAARSLTFLALAEMRRRNWDAAENHFKLAQKEFTEEGNKVHLGLVNLYQAELRLLRSQAQVPSVLTDAVKLAEAAETLFNGQRLKAKTCTARLVKARALLARGEPARQIGEQILKTCQQLESPWLHYQAHELLGDAQLATGDWRKAQEHYAQAIAFIEQIRSNIRVDEFRSAFFKDKLRVYEKLIRLCLEQGTPEQQAEAFYYLESSKARTLVDLLVSELELMPQAADPATAALHAEWQRLREELHWHYSKVNQTESAADMLGKSRLLQDGAKERAEILRCEKQLAELTQQLQAADPSFCLFEQSGGMHVGELQAMLAPDELVIEYYFDQEDLKLFVVDASQLQVFSSNYTQTQIGEQIQRLRFQLEKFQYGTKYLDTHATHLRVSINETLHQLWQALFAPTAMLARDKRLIFIPFGILHNVPFQALYDGERYLLEAHEMTQAPSARLLQLCAARRPQRFDRAAIFGAADAIAPQITEEIQAISELFPQGLCQTGQAATGLALAQAAPTSDVLHIASHAVFRQDNPMFSAFKLADGWINFYDICALKLPASLVVLSGCSTGASRIYAGDEMMGLARGFLSAGAAALIVSLWAVNDPATAQLMTAFYQKLRAGQALRTALRAAALEIKAKYGHPYYWASFVMLSHS